MASPGGPRRRQNSKRPGLARSGTLFGAIKNIVTAPLSWFASTDDFEDTRDGAGKRRRLTAVPTEPAILDEDEQGPKTKRMRVGSPTQQLRREGAYLDPPSNYVRSTLSPFRSLSISRTMSIDPPPSSQSRDLLQPQRPLDSDSSMESVHPLPSFPPSTLPSFPRLSLSVPRDLHMPNSRPPFRMRTSLTPQRERSEPPPLQLLRANPTFVKPPPLDDAARAASNEPGPTLGSLVDSVRRTESPARSLLFGGRTQAEPKPDVSRAQKALHELEIYKTPLLPTRLRNASSQAPITGVPDLFRPRRKLVLMKDEARVSDRKLGRKETISPGKNGTKPYAGEGGMKKMLAKRKMELEEVEEKDDKIVSTAEEKKDEDMEEEEKSEYVPTAPLKEVPLPPKDDWYSLASSSSSSSGGSSLRVGRAKVSRVHLSRPTARSRAKFSAAFEEEGDEAMLDDDKEREELEAAAKNAPVFNIPAGFSFTKDVKPVDHDATNAKEPPIKSLPFSFEASPAASATSKPAKVEAPVPAAHPSQPLPTTKLPFSFGVPPATSTVTSEKPVSLFAPMPTIPAHSQPAEASSSKSSVPNFFARSAAFNKPLEIKTPPLTFSPQPSESLNVEVITPSPAASPSPVFTLGAPPSGNGTPSVSSGATSLFGSPIPSAPLKDAANPLWDGMKGNEQKKDQPSAAPISIFGAAAQEKSQIEGHQAPVPPPASNPFGDTARPATSASPGPLFLAPTPKPTEVADAAKSSSPFMFGAPAATTTRTTPLFGIKPTTEGGSTPAQSTPSPLFGAQPTASTTAPSSTGFPPSTSSSLFGAVSAETSKPVTSTSNIGFTPSTSGSLFGGSTAPADTLKPATSLFRITAEKPKTESETPAASSPVFPFGQPSITTTSTVVEAPKPMTVNGATPLFANTAPVEHKAPSPISFIFGSGTNSSGTDAKPASPTPFAFGAPEKETTKAGSPAPFIFGAPSTPTAGKSSAPFTFGTPSSSPIPPPIFGFGGAGGSTTGDVSKPLQVDRPVTPPKNSDEEVKMEESPTREIQQANKSNFTGFGFGNPPTTTSVLFGGPTSAPPATTSPFPFGNASPNLFGAPPMKESKSEGPKFTFGQSASPAPPANTGFNFGQSTQNAESPRPSTAGSFPFNNPSTPSSSTTGFNLGGVGQQQQSGSNLFGQQQQSGGSAPSSPSTFHQGGFNFGGSSNTTGSGFGFGSQPASPATGPSNLPQTGTPFGAGGGNTGFGSSAPSSPFSAPTQIAPSTSSGGTLFTIGAPPPQPAGGSQGRAIKKLPNRNRAKR